MAYPKPLSQKSIDKMFKDWNPEAVASMHCYFEAFANLYGSIQLRDAWEIYKQFNPKTQKKQFMVFSSIARREDVSYYIYEVDELYSDERRIDTERYIIHKSLISNGYYKYDRAYRLHKAQLDKPYYNKTDLLIVAAHRHHDDELRAFIENIEFISGEQKGKSFADAVFYTKNEKFDLDYYKSEATRKKIQVEGNRPFSEKVMDHIVLSAEFSDNPIKSAIGFLNDNDYEFESQKQVEKFVLLFQKFLNHSHLWRNCGYSPSELHAMYPQQIPKAISLGPGIQKAIAEGQMDRNEIIKKFREMGVEVVD